MDDLMDVIFHKVDKDNLRIYYTISRETGEILGRWEFNREGARIDGQAIADEH